MQKKIGDIIDAKPHKTVNFTRHHRPFDDKWKQQILQILSENDRPFNVKEITERLNHGNWMTVKQALIDLEVEGKIEHFRSGRSLLFRIKK